MKGSRPRGVSREGMTFYSVQTVLLLVSCALFPASALGENPSPAIAQTVELTPAQEAKARHIEESLVAVCCFRQALAEHHSERADAMRQELRSMIAGGATEEEVVSHFVSKYGERVLLAPEARGFNVLAYVMPALVLLCGLVIILLFLRHARKQAPAVVTPARADGPSLADFDPNLRARMRDELDRFDE